MKTLHLLILLALAGLAYASNEVVPKEADIERDILKTLEAEADALQREPRAVRLDRLLKYFMYLMKKASPKLRRRIVEFVRHPPKINRKYKSHHPRPRSSKLIASTENSGWGWTIFDALDSFGVFDYFLGGDYDDAPEPKAKANPPPRKTKKKSKPSPARSYIRAVK